MTSTRDSITKNEAVLQFILDSLDAATLKLLLVVAELKYPIKDKLSFVHQLQALDMSNENPELTKALIDGAQVRDFPLETVRGGLEKVSATLSDSVHAGGIAFGPRLPPPIDFGRFIETPPRDILGDFVGLFGPECGRVAYGAYLGARGQLSNRDADEINAYWTGLRIGRRC